MKKIISVLLTFGAFWASAASTPLPTINIPAVPAPLIAGKKLQTVIQSPVITNTSGQVAKGMHNVYFELSPYATMPVSVNGEVVNPGEKKTITVNLSSTGNRLYLPVYASSMGKTGSADYRVTVLDLRVSVCPVDFKSTDSDCFIIKTKPAEMYCAEGVSSYENQTCTKVIDIGLLLDCDPSFKKVGAECHREIVTNPILQCPPGEELSAYGTCETRTHFAQTICPTGYNLIEGVCQKNTQVSALADGTCPEASVPSSVNPAFCDKTELALARSYCNDVPASSSEQCAVLDDGRTTSCQSIHPEYASCQIRQEQAAQIVCPSGYTDNGNGYCTYLEKYSVYNTCDADWVLSGATCYLVEVIPAEKYCDDPTYSVDATQCAKKILAGAAGNCTSGFWNGTSCQIDSSLSASGNCPKGGSFSNARCNVYACPNGTYVSGSDCYSDASSNYNTQCPSGWVFSSNRPGQCAYTHPDYLEYFSVGPEGCPGGYEITSGGRCAAYASPNKICWGGDGYSYNSALDRCVKPIYYAPADYSYYTPTYSCQSGYTLSGTMCYRTTYASPTYYYCSATWTLNGKTCEQMQYKDIQYRCSSGWNIVDKSNCTRTLTKDAYPNCPMGYTNVDGRCQLVSVKPAVARCELPYSLDASGKICRMETHTPKF